MGLLGCLPCVLPRLFHAEREQTVACSRRYYLFGLHTSEKVLREWQKVAQIQHNSSHEGKLIRTKQYKE